VLQFIGIYEIEDEKAPQFFLVSPYMKNGTLAQWRKISNPSSANIAERVRHLFFSFCLSFNIRIHPSWQILEVAQGLEYIHSEGAVHGDIRGVFYLIDAFLIR
jgi:serine/threonine protein kinase